MTKAWPSKWFSSLRDYSAKAEQDVKIRKFLIKTLREAGVDRVEIERQGEKIVIGIHTAKPGLIIGRGGAGVEELKKKLRRQFLKNYKPGDIEVNILNIFKYLDQLKLVQEGE